MDKATKIGEREVVAARCWNATTASCDQVILADKGFAGKEFEAFLTKRLGVHRVRPDRRTSRSRHGRIARVRQWIEAVIDTLEVGCTRVTEEDPRVRASPRGRIDRLITTRYAP